uniref:HL08112p n=1 Tax=Drosophila melanogaster TaxID=7227 RepID=Q8MSD3_DROME|nr:HL08112p [Drosophila melanogaster]
MFDKGKGEKRKFVSLVEPRRGILALQIVYLKCQLVPVVR